MPTHRLYFLRHGETDWNAEGRLQGQKDIPLNDRGREQARQAGRKLAKLLARQQTVHDELLWCASPLSRAVETMELARTSAGLPARGFSTDPRLMELTFGEWEGLTWPQVQARAPQAASWRDGDKWNFQPPSGESYAMLADRLVPWLAQLTGEAVVTAHGGVGRVLMANLAGLPYERAALADVWQGRVAVFQNGRFDWI